MPHGWHMTVCLDLFSIQIWNDEKYFEELLKVNDREDLCDIISEFASEPWVSMQWSWASYIHISSCNTFLDVCIDGNCSLFVSCKNYKPSLTSLLKFEASKYSIIVTIHSKRILNSKYPTYRLYRTFIFSKNYNSLCRRSLLSVIMIFTTNTNYQTKTNTL